MDDEGTKAREEEADDEQISRFCDAFTTDFDGTSALIISAIEKETEPPTVIVETLTEILRGVDTWLPGETCERFESELIPHVVQVVLAKSDDAVMDAEGVECIADFLEIVLERVAHRLLYCDPCLLPTLMRILDEHRSFYENRLDGATEEKTPFVNEDGTRVSSLYLRIISHWGTIGGFTLLLRCLQASGARSETEDDQQQTPEGDDVPDDAPKETVFAFEAIQYIYRSIYAIKDHLSLEFLKQFISPLAHSSRIYVTSMTEGEFSAVPREKLLEIIHIVEIVVAQASTNDSDEEDELASTVAEAELCVQLLHLDLLLRFFTSSSLEKRIYGLGEMIDIFNKATSLHSNYYAKWICDNQLVDLLFGEKKHPELIKRALPVIRFVLASHDASSDWIDAMWICLGGRKLQAPATDRDSVTSQGADSQTHEVVRVAVNGLLVEVVGIADIEVLKHLLKLIQDSSRPLDVDMITLVSSMAKRASSLRNPALMYMWSRLQYASKVAADQAIEEIVVVLGRSLDDMEVEEESLVDVFIGLCGDSIESGTSSLSASLRLVEKIGNLVRERHIVVNKAIASRLVPALLAEMDVYEQQFKQISDDIDYSASDAEDHVHGVRERLLALRGCMAIALISVCEVSTAEVVDSVWDLCVRKANQIDESASLFFQWIEYCFRTKIIATGSEVGERLLSELLAEQLVERRFGVLDGAAMTMSALGCFHHLFRKVNIYRGGIVVYNSDGAEIDEEDEPEEVESQTLSDLLTGKSIVGVEQLWRFALHASDQSVAEEAMTLLARYHMDVAPSLVGSEYADGRKRDFVAKCIGHLCNTESQKYVTLPSAVSKQKDAISLVGRCLDCLRYFLEANQGNNGSDSGCLQSGDRDRYSALTGADGEALNKYALDNLEQKLQLLDVFPSPMKEPPFASDATSEAGTPTMMYNGPRRPSWNFRQHHSLLEAIEDENDNELRPTEEDNIGGEEEADHSVIGSGHMRRGELIIDVPSAERRLSIDTSVSGTLRPTQLTTSPAVRARPNLQWFQTDQASTSQEPDFVIQDLDAGISEVEPSDCTTQSPLVVAQLLVNWPRLFDTLFDLVDSDDEATSRRAWGLLCQLPINAEVLKHMLKLRCDSNEDVLWTNILDAATPYRLLYCLRLVEALLVSSRPKEPEKTSEDKVRRQWRERFLRLGGAQHLVDLLSDLRSRSDKTAISLSCIAAISRTLAYFARLHYSPPDLIDAKSPYDSRLTNSTLSHAFPLSGRRFESLLNLVIEMMHQSTAPSEDSSESTLLCVLELFCGLVPLNATQALATLNRETKNGVRDVLKVILSSFKTVDAQKKAINLIVEMKDQFMSRVAGQEFHEAVLKGALEMNCTGEQSQALLELIISLSSHLPAITDWVLEHAIVDKVLLKIESIISGQSTELKDSVASLSSYLRVAAAMSSKPGPLQESCLRFRSLGSEMKDRPWLLDLVARRILWDTDSNCELSIDELTTRQAAQDMVSALVFSSGLPSSPYAMCILRQLTNYYNTIQSRFETMGRPWNIRPTDEIQDPSPDGIHFAGLVNPGCVCYMNSLMQQLFMMPAFRNGLLSIDASSSTTEWQNEIAELQKLFVALSASQRRALDPTEFALSHRDMDGNPTDLNVQMDADEFFCLLLDRVETCVLKSSASRPTADGQATFLDQCFGGVLVNQILTEHGHLSEREEKFFALSLDISQKQHLPESLSLYVEGETLDGDNAYYCEQAKKKVSATKRVCIKKLPQTLVCHLKRFEFDFDTMEKIKIHDYLAFPEEIDMFPYTSEAFSAKRGDNSSVASIMYDLVGIVVHSGSSDMGHYYSFIKDRTAAADDPSSWYEFNDQTVKPFDVSTMGDECFGGEEVSQKWDQSSRAYTPMVHRKRRSAYMLVYERRNGEEHRTDITATEIVDWDATPASVQKLREVVLQENQELRHIVNSTTQGHINFLNQLVNSCFERKDDNHPQEDDISEEEPQTRDVHVFDDITEAVLDTEDTDLHAAIIACKHVFGVSSLLSTDDETAIGTLLESVEGWIRTETAAAEGRKVLFCRWLLTQAVSSSTTSRSDRGFIRRSWLFDVLVFCEKRLPFMQSCCSLLQSSLQFLATHARTDRDQQAAIEFLRYIGKLFYDRHEVVIEDPASGSRFPVPQASVIHASTILGSFLKDCVNTEHGDSIKNLFLAKSGFVDRFLFSFQENESPRKAGSSLMAPLTSRVRSCTYSLERQLFSDVSTSLTEMREDILEDPRLLMCHSVLKNIVSFEFTEVLTPLIVYSVERQMSRAQGDKLVSLLLAVLEEVKSTHLEQLLHIFGALLDAENQRGSTGGLASVHEHIFSPSSGLLEAAAYYRDHRTLHEYAFLLVEFVITRAEASPRLQRYFQNDEEIAGQVEWVKHWLGSYLDPSGTIRRTIDDDGEDGNTADSVQSPRAGTRHQQDDPTLDKEVRLIFKKAERAFGFAMLTTQTLAETEQTHLDDNKAFAVESLEDSDGLLFSSDGENQDDDDDDNKRDDPSTGKALSSKRPFLSERRLSLKSSRAASANERRRPEVDEQPSSSSSTIVTRAHMSSAA